MILGGLEFLLLGALVGGAIIAYWEELVSFAKKVFENLPLVVKNTILGVASYIARVKTEFGFKLQDKVSFFSKDKQTNEWTETIATKTVNESEVPKEILAKLRQQQQVETTDELKNILQLQD
ncbi:hypothetical protein L291_0403 [Acinetobacter guillouiae MSP4-18]|uniref:hypothetical protein n=1 Tax=Acinetobacter guillouiae TaxID=106649 RepID=UPI00035497C6|nr:hypothetical protein [Acinetobacter guillouiae]EPH37530.1 hypothetical protein L291_0403 [Acinetobacter guillouiae MSP4-18]KAB0629726.1 hypothetical protein F7P82_02760 [Acinetobacter guillouiae]